MNPVTQALGTAGAFTFFALVVCLPGWIATKWREYRDWHLSPEGFRELVALDSDPEVIEWSVIPGGLQFIDGVEMGWSLPPGSLASQGEVS